MVSFSLNSARRAIGIAIAILVVAACSPSRAVAECGDYVHIVKNVPETGSQAPQAPCEGPNCSSKPATPTAPLTAPVNDSESAKQITSRSGCDADLDDNRERITRQHLSDLPDPILASIFHPPRIS